MISILAKVDSDPTDNESLLLGALGNLQACSTNCKILTQFPPPKGQNQPIFSFAAACHKTMIDKGTVEMLVKIVPHESAEFSSLIKYIKTVALGGLMLHGTFPYRLLFYFFIY